MSCRFKHQIKLIGKILSQGSQAPYYQCRANPHASDDDDDDRPTFFFGNDAFREPFALEDQEKPTFFFGDRARAQLVDPIEGDSHFTDLPKMIEELSAKLV